jgi:hypothetical protein
LAALASVALSQTAPPADSDATYGSFLWAVVAQKTDLRRPSPGEAIGLTEAEAQVLSDVAEEWASKGRGYFAAERSLRREAFFQSIEAEELPAKVVEQRAKKLAERLSNLQGERARAIQEQVQKLRASLGAERFQLIEAFIRSKAPTGGFFPAPAGPVHIQVRK